MSPKQQKLLESKIQRIYNEILNEAPNTNQQVLFYLKTIKDVTDVLIKSYSKNGLDATMLSNQLTKITESVSAIKKITKTK
jgi:hypothetical protein